MGIQLNTHELKYTCRCFREEVGIVLSVMDELWTETTLCRTVRVRMTIT